MFQQNILGACSWVCKQLFRILFFLNRSETVWGVWVWSPESGPSTFSSWVYSRARHSIPPRAAVYCELNFLWRAALNFRQHNLFKSIVETSWYLFYDVGPVTLQFQTGVPAVWCCGRQCPFTKLHVWCTSMKPITPGIGLRSSFKKFVMACGILPTCKWISGYPYVSRLSKPKLLSSARVGTEDAHFWSRFF